MFKQVMAIDSFDTITLLEQQDKQLDMAHSTNNHNIEGHIVRS